MSHSFAKTNLSDQISVTHGSWYLHSPLESIVEINLKFGPSLEFSLFDWFVPPEPCRLPRQNSILAPFRLEANWWWYDSFFRVSASQACTRTRERAHTQTQIQGSVAIKEWHPQKLCEGDNCLISQEAQLLARSSFINGHTPPLSVLFSVSSAICLSSSLRLPLPLHQSLYLSRSPSLPATLRSLSLSAPLGPRIARAFQWILMDELGYYMKMNCLFKLPSFGIKDYW